MMPPSSQTSASTVGFPRESSISLPTTFVILFMFFKVQCEIEELTKILGRGALSPPAVRSAGDFRAEGFDSFQVLPDSRESIDTPGVDEVSDGRDQLIEAALGFLFHAQQGGAD